MQHVTNVFLVDAHTKGVGGQDQIVVAVHELFLQLTTAMSRKVAVVNQMIDPIGEQTIAELDQFPYQREVHDSWTANFRSHFGDLFQLHVVIPNFFDGQRKVGSIDAFVKQQH